MGYLCRAHFVEVAAHNLSGTSCSTTRGLPSPADALGVTSSMPSVGSESVEDFAYMLEARPGALIYLGNGSTARLHHPAYDFNDEALPYGIGYWVNLVETTLAA